MTDDTKFVLGMYLRNRLTLREAASERAGFLITTELENIESIAAMYGYEVSVQPRSKS